MRIHSVLYLYLRLPIASRLIILALSTIFIFGAIIHIVEPQSFPSLFDGIWWAVVTVSTVGYGDYAPNSHLGRVVGIFLILIGASFMTYYFASLSAATVKKQNSYIEGKANFKGDKHIVLIGWNERIRETLNQLHGLNPKLSILLVDETLNKNPVPYNNVTFIKGNPTYDETLDRADIAAAEMIIISADQSKNEVHADMATILTLVAARGLNPNLYCIVEVLTSKQVLNATRAGADEIIQTNKLSSFVMTNSILSHGLSETLLVMLDHLAGNKIEYIIATGEENNKPYQQCVHQLLNKSVLLIGVKRGEETFINPSPYFIIYSDDQLLVIKH